jgi:hypothetical protein
MVKRFVRYSLANRSKTLVALAALLLTSLVGVVLFAGMALAREGRATIEVVFRNIQIMVNGERLAIPAGSEPFIYQGRIYVPLGLVAGAVGKPVTWDGPNFTVHIGRRPEGVFLSSHRAFFSENIELAYDEEAGMAIAGTRYSNGISIRRFWQHPQGRAVFRLNAEFTRMRGLIGFDDNHPYASERNIFFYGDGRRLHTATIRPGELPQTVDIDLTGVVLLSIVNDNREVNFHATRRQEGFYTVNLVQFRLIP